MGKQKTSANGWSVCDPGRIHGRIYDKGERLTLAKNYVLNRLYQVHKVTRDDAIRERYVQGESLSALAREFSLTPARISQIVKPMRR